MSLFPASLCLLTLSSEITQIYKKSWFVPLLYGLLVLCCPLISLSFVILLTALFVLASKTIGKL